MSGDYERGVVQASAVYQEVINEYVAENAKLRGLVSSVLVLRHDPVYEWLDARLAEIDGKGFTEQARELGIEAGNDD